MERADQPNAVRLGRQQRVLTFAIVGTVGALLVLLAAWVQHQFLEDGPRHQWNPLGDYPTQVVENRTPVLPGQTVDIIGTKCVAADHPVTVLGESGWRAVSPPGASVPLGEGQTVRYPAGTKHTPDGVPLPDDKGCTTFHYRNAIPAVVAAQALIDCRATGVPSTWKLSGREVPVKPNGERGAPRVWQSETFKLGC